MEISELKPKTKLELESLLSEKRAALLSLRMKVEGKQLKNIRELREARKAIAQICTVLNQKR
jgi:ribosomal protein L29